MNINLITPWSSFAQLHVLPEIPTINTCCDKGIAVIESLTHGLHFLHRFIRNPTEVGSILPSSAALAESIVSQIPEDTSSRTEGKRYLEIGPGTGAFTIEIVKRLGDNDQLDIVEIDETFCDILKTKYANYPNIHIYCQSITEWDPEYKYDAIVSGLPLNAFGPEKVAEFIETFTKLTKEEGTISYFEYAYLPSIKIKALFGEELEKFKKVLEIKTEFFNNFGFSSETVYYNIPPAKVLHFKVGSPNVPKSPVSFVSNTHRLSPFLLGKDSN